MIKNLKVLLVFVVLHGATMIGSEGQKVREIQLAQDKVSITMQALIEAANNFDISEQALQAYKAAHQHSKASLEALMIQHNSTDVQEVIKK